MSHPNVQLTRTGLHVSSTRVSCTNVCDPYCKSAQNERPDVDASSIVSSPDGGVTLDQSDAGVVVKQSTNCRDLQCKLVTCTGMGVTTTISGTVYDPAGNNPMYNANVYIPVKAKEALPVFGTGASCDTCAGAPALVALRSAKTDSSGNFTLSDVPAGANIPIVIQMGKWRREIVLSSVAPCTSNAVAGNCTAPNPADCVFRLPKNHSDGYDPVAGTYTKADVPKIAIVSGSADPFDCLLVKAGLDPAEFGDANSSKRFHFYQSDSSPGNKLSASYGAAINGSTLTNNLNGAGTNLMSYDVVLLPCEGGNIDKQTAGNALSKSDQLRRLGRTSLRDSLQLYLATVPIGERLRFGAQRLVQGGQVDAFLGQHEHAGSAACSRRHELPEGERLCDVAAERVGHRHA